jgi:hypothetical protein
VKRILIFFLTVIFSLNAFSQVTFERMYGGEISFDEGNSVIQTSDGGYVIVGTTESFGAGSDDIYLIRTNGLGDTLWTKTYGGQSGDWGNCVIQSSDGGFVILGTTNSFGAGAVDFWLIKTNSQGDTLWTKTFGGIGSDIASSVIETFSGDFVMVGSTPGVGPSNRDCWLIKVDATGDTLWTKTYGGNYAEEGNSLIQVSDSGYVVVGATNSWGPGDYNINLVRTNSNGDTLWTKTYGGTSDDKGFSVVQSSDGTGFIITGEKMQPNGYTDLCLIKASNSGAQIWEKTYGGPFNDTGYSIKLSGGSYIVVGEKFSGVTSFDIFLLKINNLGDTLWSRTYGGLSLDYGFSAIPTSDSGYMVVGATNSFSTWGDNDVYLIKTDGVGNVGIHEPNKDWNIYIFPNPASNELTIQNPELKIEQIGIFDVLGDRIFSRKPIASSEQLLINVSTFPAGVYFIVATDGKNVARKKFIKE